MGEYFQRHKEELTVPSASMCVCTQVCIRGEKKRKGFQHDKYSSTRNGSFEGFGEQRDGAISMHF